MADKTGVILFVTLLCMTFGTVIHLHAVPWVRFPSRYIFSPYIDAVSGYAVGPVFGQDFALAVVSVADPAFLFTHLHMGDMGKIDTVPVACNRKARGSPFLRPHILSGILSLRVSPQWEIPDHRGIPCTFPA